MTRATAIRLHPDDNVAVVTLDVEAGEALPSLSVVPVDPIPAGHKIALSAIRAEEPVRKYGQVIGRAVRDIAEGDHVHTHNMEMTHQRERAGAAQAWTRDETARTFQGFRRPDGRVGVRNYVCILTSVNCSATVARLLAEEVRRSGLLDAYPNVDGVVPITHTSGCGMAMDGEGFDLLRRTLWGTAANPNFAATLLVGLGCEVIQVDELVRDFGIAEGQEFSAFTIQEAGGTSAAIAEGMKRIEPLLAAANGCERTTVPAGELVLGLQCGGSDGWSGITSNPALGNAADRLVALGGSVMLSETPEIFGAEHILAARAVEPGVAALLDERLDWWSDYTAKHGAKMDNNPSPGNVAGGLTTILEKSLGAVMKGGTSPLQDVIRYGEPLRSKGLTFMDSPGFDPCSATGQVASGATMIAFTTGRGSAFGFQPSPSIKLSSNSAVATHMNEDIDIDCGPIAAGESTIEDKGAEILDYLLDVASGKASKSESLGYGGAEFVPWIIGATM